MAKKKIRLNHFCHRKGAEGEPGDVVEIDEKLADSILEIGGGVDVEKEAADKKKADAELEK